MATFRVFFFLSLLISAIVGLSVRNFCPLCPLEGSPLLVQPMSSAVARPSFSTSGKISGESGSVSGMGSWPCGSSIREAYP